MPVKLPKGLKEQRFYWPPSVPRDQQVCVVCTVPKRTERLRVDSECMEEVVYEGEGGTVKTHRNYRMAEQDQRYRQLAVRGIENLATEDGTPIDPNEAAKSDKLEWLFQCNAGYDEETYGIFEADFMKWFRKTILRSREEERKNSKPSAEPPSGTGAAQT